MQPLLVQTYGCRVILFISLPAASTHVGLMCRSQCWPVFIHQFIQFLNPIILLLSSVVYCNSPSNSIHRTLFLKYQDCALGTLATAGDRSSVWKNKELPIC